MPDYKWPENRQVMGTRVPRVDGVMKVTGKAKYSYDRNLPGMLHAKILRSPFAHARIKKLDLSRAEKMPGVKAVHIIKGPGSELHYHGDEIAAVAAETEEQARDALREIVVEYEVLPHIAKEEDGLKTAREPATEQRGNVDQALKDADVTIEGFYGAPVLGHVCLETHGLVAHWKSDSELVVYASTQAVGATAGALRNHFRQRNLRVICETPFMGGGFGSKFGPDVQGIVAAELARKAARPVKLMLERDEEHLAAGNRPSAYATIKAGASKDGTLLAIDAETYGTGGHSQGANFPFPYIYVPQARRRRHTNVHVNAGSARALRAPGHPQAALIMEQVMDDLADKLGMDPVEFRIKNLPDSGVFRQLKAIYERELKLGAERIGWSRRHKRGDPAPGPLKRGLGVGLGNWGGRAGQAQAVCTIHPDGRVEIKCGSQDLGTGTTTIVPVVAAEILGLQPADITPLIGSSEYPPSGASGGSTTCGGVSTAVAVASFKAREELFKLAARELGADPKDCQARAGRIFAGSKSLTWKQACTLMGQTPISTQGRQDEAPNLSSQGVGGVQFADVTVDIETGVVRVNRIVAVADCGLVVDRLLCESQVFGGVIMGLNAALFEERRLDPATGRMLNPDLEWYKLAGHSDVPDIEVHLLDYPERGVIGIGEPPYIPTAAAIANAVCNAIGVRVGVIPLSPRRILEALEKK